MKQTDHVAHGGGRGGLFLNETSQIFLISVDSRAAVRNNSVVPCPLGPISQNGNILLKLQSSDTHGFLSNFLKCQ